MSLQDLNQSLFSDLDWVQNRLRGLLGDALFSTLELVSHKRNIAIFPLVYRYFHRKKCSDQLHSFVLSSQNFTAQAPHLMCKGSTQPHTFCIPVLRKKFQLLSKDRCFMEQIAKRMCFHVHDILNHFQSKINHCLNITSLFGNHLTWVALEHFVAWLVN